MQKSELDDMIIRHDAAFKMLAILKQNSPMSMSILDALEQVLIDCRELFEYIDELKKGSGNGVCTNNNKQSNWKKNDNDDRK